MANDQPLTKEAILDAAAQVLRRYGPEKTSVVDVAKVLQVSHGTLYRHFPSKAALREAVTERWLLHISDSLQLIADQTQGSAQERLHLWFVTLISIKRTFRKEDPEMFSMYANVTLESVEIIQHHVNYLISQLAQIIEAGVKAAEFHTEATDVTAKAVFLATSRFHHPAHAREWSSATSEQEFENVWQLILTGLK
ncbi:TetR family transcriptional regulator [Paenibacillus marchantiophytorum]|uniref:TetR family transcriptional regulator n=1 Tax=Paenibacillus marchantiophytorum TaxID=1619310 RepID=A0ABQ1FEU9_9BACL|nr:TetR family transcriptional regulator [Paenibacillus marchantiophytorum]GGA09476.1 TetR family transcriptional regulator [Paenibacillus marchantiophytorum]